MRTVFAWKNLWIWVLLTVVSLGWFLFPQVVEAKSFEITNVIIRAVVLPNGSMEVRERRTYNFEGNYSFAYLYINKDPDQTKKPGRTEPYELSDFEVCDTQGCYQQVYSEIDYLPIPERARSYYVSDEGDRYYIKWYFDVTNAPETFELRYTIDNAVTLHSDVGEVYWQWVGDEWEISQNNVQVEVLLPDGIPDNQIDAWAHGLLNGRISIPSASEVVFTTPRVGVGEFFEGRIIVPRDIFTTGARGTLSAGQIRDQEATFIAQTIAQQRSRQVINYFLALVNIALVATQLYFGLKAIKSFQTYHQEIPLPTISFSGRIWEPPSDLSPAQVEQVIAAKQTLSTKTFTATVLNLVHLRVFKFLRSDQKHGRVFKDWKYYLLPTNTKPKVLGAVETAIYNFLMDM